MDTPVHGTLHGSCLKRNKRNQVVVDTLPEGWRHWRDFEKALEVVAGVDR